MAAESIHDHSFSEQLGENRLLTEADHLLSHRHGNGWYDAAAVEDVLTNLSTAVQEIAMPYAVTTTFQRTEHTVDPDGRRGRLFMWLGKCAVEVAESGRKFHFSEAALKRVDVEVAEARHAQEHLHADVAHVFISPKMSTHDAPESIAKQEHLAVDDSIRVSRLVTDSTGRALGRRLDSLLVRDIPLSAWTAMLQDPGNIFGKAFVIRDEDSALPIMELFEQLELPVDMVSEGPVTIVEAVLLYIADAAARQSVTHQLERFRHDQELYTAKAEEFARQWLDFEAALADSLAAGTATLPLQAFIASLQHEWGEKELATIIDHQLPDGEYRMTRSLAALLEKAKRNVLNAAAAIATGNEQIVSKLDTQAAQDIQDSLTYVSYLRSTDADAGQVAAAIAVLERHIAHQNITVGGGCPGDIEGSFGGSKNGLDGGIGSAETKSSWQWKAGVCRVKNCPSPRPTEVGPCMVCRGCQHMFDIGRDPTKMYGAPAQRKPATQPLPLFQKSFKSTAEKSPQKQIPQAAAHAAGELAMAA